MDAGAGGRGVQHQAGNRMAAVGDFSALVGRKHHRGVGIAESEDGEARSLKRGTQTQGEGEGKVLLDKLVSQARSRVRPPVRRVEDDKSAVHRVRRLALGLSL